jgi:hypothetical protein
MWVQVASRAVSLPPLCVMSSVRPVESLTETALSEGTEESAMMPFTVALLLGAAALDVAEPGADEEAPVSPEPVFVLDPPPELPHAASSATPPAPAPISSWRRGHVKVDGSTTGLLDKGNLRKRRGVCHAVSRAKQMNLWNACNEWGNNSHTGQGPILANGRTTALEQRA